MAVRRPGPNRQQQNRPTPTRPVQETKPLDDQETNIPDPEEVEQAAATPLPDVLDPDVSGEGEGDPDAAEGDTAPGEHVPQAPDGRILEPGDDLVFEGDSTHYGMVIPNENVYRKIYPRGCKRPTYVQLVHKGVPVPTTHAKPLSF